MGRADYLKLGDWNAACYECGRKRKASELKKHWRGYYVCPEHWEPRHPQDFVKPSTPEQPPTWTQPQVDDEATMCTILGRNAIAGIGVAGCAVAGLVIPDTY